MPPVKPPSTKPQDAPQASRAPEPGTFVAPPVPTQPAGSYAAQAIAANNARMVAASAPQKIFRGRQDPAPNNRPTPGRFTAELEAANAEAAEQRTKAVAHRMAPANRKWIKIGLQPGVGGYILHTEYYEGDVKVRETVQRNLSPLGAREKLALHMAAISQVF